MVGGLLEVREVVDGGAYCVELAVETGDGQGLVLMVVVWRIWGIGRWWRGGRGK